MMWVVIQECKDKLSIFEILCLNGKVDMRLNLCLISRINPQTIQKNNSNSLLRQVLLMYQISNLIIFLSLDNIVLSIRRNSKENIVSEANPVIIANFCPFVRLIDEVNDHTGLESLEH